MSEAPSTASTEHSIPRRSGAALLAFILCELVYFLVAGVLQLPNSNNPGEALVAIGLVACLQIPIVFALLYGLWILIRLPFGRVADHPVLAGLILGCTLGVIDTFSQLL